MIILLVRHGETEHNLLGMQGVVGNDAPLNGTGRAQAERAAKICKEYSPSHIYSSPFERCKQTANIISSATNATVTTTKELIEFDMGDWAHLKSEETKKLLTQNSAWDFSPEKYSFRVPGGESWQDVSERASRLLEQIIEDNDTASTIVLVSHNATIRALVGIMHEAPFQEWFGFPFQNAAVSGFKYDNGTFTELFINKT